MKITQEQIHLLDTFSCERIKNVDAALVYSIRGAVIDGKENQLANLFKRKINFDEDHENILASYVVISPTGIVLAYFSLRCGELYREIDEIKMEKCSNAWYALLRYNRNPPPPIAERIKCMKMIKEAVALGCTNPDEFRFYAKKKPMYQEDKATWSDHNIAQVLDAFPAVELKYFGVNEAAKTEWNSYGFPQRLGETIFWKVVMDKIEFICNNVGCQYLFLFAADKDPDGDLVNYYQTSILESLKVVKMMIIESLIEASDS